MGHKIIKALFGLALAAVLSGCADAQEPDTLGYVVAIGIDKAEDEKRGYDFTIQFANPSKISGGSSEEGGKGGQDSIENITVTAPSIYSAVNVANHIVSKTFVLSHTKLIVFSKDISKEGIGVFLEAVGRSSDIRPNTYLAMSECKAKEFLEAVNPETEINPVRYYTMIFENDYSGFVPQNMLMDFYFNYRSSEKNPVMPVCSVSGKRGTLKYSDTGYQNDLEDYKAGELPSAKEEAQVIGMAVFEGDTQVGDVGEIETEIYNIMLGKYKRSYVSYFYSKTPNDTITVIQQQRKKPKIRVDTSGDIPEISIQISLESDFASSTPESTIEDHLDDFAKEVTAEIKKECENFLEMTREMGTDIVGFGSYAKRNFMSLDEYNKYDWKSKYKKAKFDVEVDFSVRRTGLVVRSEKE